MKATKMKNYYVRENNSGGYTLWLDCLIENSGRPEMVRIIAKDLKSAINKLEKHTGMDIAKMNSYEGTSCNCCGRRFEFYCDEDSDESCMDKYVENVWHNYYKGVRLVELKDSPKDLKKIKF